MTRRAVGDNVVVLAHWSGHWSLDEDGGQHWTPVDERLTDLGVTLFTNTERRTDTRLPGWESWTPSRDTDLQKLHGRDSHGAECPVHHDTTEWTSIARGAEQVTTLGVKRRGGDTRPGVWLTHELLQHRTGFTHLAMAEHNASGVQRGKRWRGGRLGAWAQGKATGARRVRVWVSAAIGTRTARRRLVKQYRPDEQTLAMDSNVDSRKARWATVLRGAYAGPRLRLLRLERGTKGRRGIDVIFTTMRTVRGQRARVLDLFGRLDHGGVVAVLRPRPKTVRGRGALHSHPLQQMASPTTEETR